MNLAHLHLLLNHFPTVGMIVGLAMFFTGVFWKSDQIKRTSLGVILGIALLAIPTYMSGNAALSTLAGNKNLHLALIEAHQSWALLGFIMMEITGLLAWVGLWQYRRHDQFPPWIVPTVLALSLATFGIMAVTSSIGGELMHPEIRTVPEGSVDWTIHPLAGSYLGKIVKDSRWIWAACESLHFIGLAILFGTVILLDLRILGFLKGIPFEAVHKLLPWGVAAFAVNLATGMAFFLAAYDQYTTNVVFHWKIALIMVAGANAGYFTVFDDSWVLKAGEDAPARAKFAAAAAMVVWVGVMYCGRMLPFIGNAF